MQVIVMIIKKYGYYLEYEFPEEVYAFSSKYVIANGSGHTNTKEFVIQAYDETGNNWINISDNLSWTGNGSTNLEEEAKLNYTNPYKRYRIYVTGIKNNDGDHGMAFGTKKFQLYGILKSDMTEQTEENMKEVALNNANIDELSLDLMLTSSDFTEKLMNNRKAIDYMIAHTGIIDKVVLSQVAMKSLGESKYGGYKVIMNDSTRSKVLNSTYIDDFNKGSVSVPKLTADTPEIIGSSYWNGSWAYYLAFDKNESTEWSSGGGVSADNTDRSKAEYLGYNFGKNVIVYQVKLKNGYENPGYRCGDFYIQGASENKEDKYEDLTSKLTAAQNDTMQSFNITTLKANQFFRILIMSNPTGYCAELYELQFYCREIPEGM